MLWPAAAAHCGVLTTQLDRAMRHGEWRADPGTAFRPHPLLCRLKVVPRGLMLAYVWRMACTISRYSARILCRCRLVASVGSTVS